MLGPRRRRLIYDIVHLIKEANIDYFLLHRQVNSSRAMYINKQQQQQVATVNHSIQSGKGRLNWSSQEDLESNVALLISEMSHCCTLTIHLFDLLQ